MLIDHIEIPVTDPDAARMRWKLQFRGLTKAEWLTLDHFVADHHGGVDGFTFLDPFTNLIASSEEFTSTIWVRDPLLGIAAGQVDPWGTLRASRITNSGQAVQQMKQRVNAPSNYTYSLSLWARSDSAAAVGVSVGEGEAGRYSLSQSWQRIEAPVRPTGNYDYVDVALSVDSGVQADICGIQLEAQPASGPYCRTSAQAGVYLGARFLGNSYTCIARASDVFDADIEVIA